MLLTLVFQMCVILLPFHQYLSGRFNKSVRRNKVWCRYMSPWPFLQFSSHYLNNYDHLLGCLFLHEFWFDLVLFLNLVWYGPICWLMMHQHNFVFWYWYLHFYSTLFIEYHLTQNISTHIFFLLFVFSFPSLDSVSFDKLFVLFLSGCILIFLILSKSLFHQICYQQW